MAYAEAADQPPAVVLLYADFPGLGDRWERDTPATAALVFAAHDRFAEAVAAHGGAAVPAWLDARCARFPSAVAALGAALAVRRAMREAGDLAIRLAVARGPAWPGGEVPVLLLRRARALAEAAATDEVRLDAPAAAGLAGELPAGARLRRSRPRGLPGLGRWTAAFVLRQPSSPSPAARDAATG